MATSPPHDTTWDEDDDFDQDPSGDGSGHGEWDHEECDPSLVLGPHHLIEGHPPPDRGDTPTTS